MGCSGSKQKHRLNCKRSHLPLLRSYSMHPPAPIREADDDHGVALTSSTLGSLTVKLDLLDHNHHQIIREKESVSIPLNNKEEVAVGIIDEAQTWSKTPREEPEIIDAWEMMEGIEDISPVSLKLPFHNNTRSFSFHFSSYHSFHDNFTPTMHTRVPALDGSDDQAIFTVDDSKKSTVGGEKPRVQGKEKVILYFTSLRGVRKTYDDCCNVREVLKGLQVKVDERDVSMHSGFKTELKDLLGEGWSSGGNAVLPKVFIGRRCIGGVEEIRRMHEDGELKKAVEDVALVDDGGAGVCVICGDVRFVPCGTCFGSCKVYYEADYENSVNSGFRRCHDCNENGLIRCPTCADS